MKRISNKFKKNFSQNGKFIIVDIGSHTCGEIKSLTDSRFFFFKLIKRIIKNLYKRKFINIISFGELISNHFKIKKLIKKITLILVEPNYLHFNENPYQYSSLVLPVAIKNLVKDEVRVTKLFLANNDPMSAGNSIFISKGNVNKSNFKNVLTLNTSELFDILNNLYLKNNSKIILRINCEGMEDEIIYDFKKFFPNKLKGVMGSLKDVKSIKGNKEYNKLINFIDEKKIKFIPFSDDIDTWLNAHKFIYDLLVTID